MKSNSVMEQYLDEARRVVGWKFPKTKLEPVEYQYSRDVARLTGVDFQFAVRGIVAKIGDAAAIPRDVETGAAATVEEKRDAMLRVRDALYEGDWNVARVSKPRLVNVDALIAAIAAATGKPVIGVRTFIEGLDEEARKKLSRSAEFGAGYTVAVAQQRPTTSLSEDLVAGLEAIEG